MRLARSAILPASPLGRDARAESCRAPFRMAQGSEVSTLLTIIPFRLDADDPVIVFWLSEAAPNSTKCGSDCHYYVGECLVDLVLPEPKNSPPTAFQTEGLPPIALDVCGELVGPEVATASRTDIVFGTAVPEASVDEDRDACANEADVCTAESGLEVLAVSESFGPELPAEPELGAGVLAPDPGHLLRSVECHLPRSTIVNPGGNGPVGHRLQNRRGCSWRA